MLNSLKEKGFNNIDKYLDSINIQDILTELPDNNECQLRVSVTQLCNESCFFCHNEGNEKTRVDFDSELFKKIIDVMLKYNLHQRVRFTGGEPLLYDGLESLIKFVKKKNKDISVGLTTNALLLEERAESLISSGIDKITISIHSLDNDTYKDITKVDGLNKVLKGLEKLRDLGFKGEVSVNSVIGKNNIEEVSALKIFCEKYTYKLKVLPLLPISNDLELKYSLTRRQIEEIHELNNIRLKGDKTQEKCLDCSKKTICGGEAEYLRLSPDGVLNPCLSLKEFDINLKDIKGDSNFEKAVLLAFRRIKTLNI